MKIYLNIGTNIGDRHENIKRAVSAIEHTLQCKAVICDVITTMPWGYKSDNFFCNQGIMIEKEIEPLALLDTLQRIEKELGSAAHRDADGNYMDRLIDIDIMDIDGVKMKSKRLTLPHPHLYERPFFLMPYLVLKGF